MAYRIRLLGRYSHVIELSEVHREPTPLAGAEITVPLKSHYVRARVTAIRRLARECDASMAQIVDDIDVDESYARAV